MKKSLLLCALAMFFWMSGISKGKNKQLDSSSCLEISGRITTTNKKVKKPYKVELISYNKIVDSLFISDKAEFKFTLNKNCHYAIRISRPGYISRLISVYTNVPEDIDALYRFQFDTELIEESFSGKLESDALDFPITIVSFHPDLNNFYYSEEYTSNLKRQMYLRQTF